MQLEQLFYHMKYNYLLHHGNLFLLEKLIILMEQILKQLVNHLLRHFHISLFY